MSNVNMKELVKNAPVGASYYRVDTDCYYKIDCDDASFYFNGEWIDSGVSYVQMGTDFIKLEFNMNIDDIAKEDCVSLKPVYTQAMADNGTPPLASSSVIVALSHDELGERLGEFSGKEVDIIASTNFDDKTILTVSHYMLGVAAMCMNQGLFTPVDRRTTDQKQLDHVTHLVGSMSHLPAIETGQAIIDYLKG